MFVYTCPYDDQVKKTFTTRSFFNKPKLVSPWICKVNFNNLTLFLAAGVLAQSHFMTIINLLP